MPEMQYKSTSSYISALMLSLPVAAIIGFVVIYPVYGLTGESIHLFFHIVTFSFFYLMVFSWALYGSQKTAEVSYRICKLGSIISPLLPVSAGITSMLWFVNAAERPDDFLTGYSALEIPVYAVGVAFVFILIFLSGSSLAARDMEGISF